MQISHISPSGIPQDFKYENALWQNKFCGNQFPQKSYFYWTMVTHVTTSPLLRSNITIRLAQGITIVHSPQSIVLWRLKPYGCSLLSFLVAQHHDKVQTSHSKSMVCTHSITVSRISQYIHIYNSYGCAHGQADGRLWLGLFVYI